MKSSRHIIASIFLMIFSFIELADLHVLDHDDNDVDCTFCQFAFDHQDDGFISSEITTLPDVIVIPADIVRNTYEQRYFDVNNNYSFLNKAPPVLA